MQVLTRAEGGRSYTILCADGSVQDEADDFLRSYEGSGTQKTYAYSLVDHLRWCEREKLTAETVTLRDLLRYMGAVGAQVQMPWEQPWRLPPKRPYGVNTELRSALAVERLPTKADRSRAFLGHAVKSMQANPLAPTGRPTRRHPKMLPDGAKPSLLERVNTARDAMVVQWLSDTAIRIGGLTDLHLVDLTLRRDAACGECRDPHVHVCHRWGNQNRAAAKIKPDWQMVDGLITGGEIYRASPAMISRYFHLHDDGVHPVRGRARHAADPAEWAAARRAVDGRRSARSAAPGWTPGGTAWAHQAPGAPAPDDQRGAGPVG
ncbi:hypothetical protein ACH40D_46150 [Streptomyces olivaceoviridis]|uniref:Integrase n=1 Tax=Streptomyces olivaceoviridis TaxID=1921 RepID=A0ABW7VNH0_STROI|nr:hypothetical protein [Streptomyces corchorusii]